MRKSHSRPAPELSSMREIREKLGDNQQAVVLQRPAGHLQDDENAIECEHSEVFETFQNPGSATGRWREMGPGRPKTRGSKS